MRYSWVLHTTDQQDQAAEKFKDWTAIALSFNEKLGLQPSIITLNGKGYSGETSDFGEGYKQATDNAFKDLRGISLYTENPNGEDFAFYSTVLMNISFSDTAGFTVYIGVDMDVVEKEQVFNDAVLPVCGLLNVNYGYSYIMPPEKGPFSYAKGFVHVPGGYELSDEERMLVYDWGSYKKSVVIGEGFLRDVYQENLLSELQLDLPVEMELLQDWILSDPSHGKLSDIAGNALWKIDRDDLVKVRDILHKNGLLIAYHENVIPGLPD